MIQRLVPGTYHLSIPDLTSHILSETGSTQNASRCVNKLIQQQKRTAPRNYGEYAPLFRNMLLGQLPSTRIEGHYLSESDLVVDALAVWSIATENLTGSSTWRNPAHVESLGIKTMALLADVTSVAVDWQAIGTVPSPTEVCLAYKLHEQSRV